MIQLLKHNVSDEALRLEQSVTHAAVVRAIKRLAKERNIPLDVRKDSFYISDGALLSGLFAREIPCVAMSHPVQKDKYYTLLIELRNDYNKPTAFVHFGGTSRNIRNINMANMHAQNHGSGLFSSFLAGDSEAKFRDEQMYYDALLDLIAAGLVEAQYPDPKPQRAAPKKESAPKKETEPKKDAAPKKETEPKKDAAPKKASAPRNSAVAKNNYGLVTMGDQFTPIIMKETPLPASNTIEFSTAADNQTAVEIHAVCGCSHDANECRSLGKYILDGISPAPRGVPRIVITFTLDEDSQLEITAVDTASGKELNVTARSEEKPAKQEAPESAPAVKLGKLSASHQELDLPEYFLSLDNDATFMTDAGLCVRVSEKSTCVPTRTKVLLSLKAGQTVRLLDGITPVCDMALIGLTDYLQPVEFTVMMDTKAVVEASAMVQTTGQPLTISVTPQKAAAKSQPPAEKKAPKKSTSAPTPKKDPTPAPKAAPAPAPKTEPVPKAEPVPEATAAPKNIDDQLRRIRELHELLQMGALTQEEFELLKKSILS